jgi:hypothetical protein
MANTQSVAEGVLLQMLLLRHCCLCRVWLLLLQQ